MASVFRMTKNLDNLLGLVERHCNGKEIKGVLRNARSLNKLVRISGKNKGDVLQNLKDAVALKIVTAEDIYRLVTDAEESGSQLIYLFLPKSTEISSLCQNGLAFADRLFGADWQQTKGFPLLREDKRDEEWSDFRIDHLDAEGSSWTAKLEVGVERKINPPRRREGSKSIIEHDLVTRQEKYLIKWRHDGFLEIRTPVGSSKEQQAESLQRACGSSKSTLKIDESFDPLDLEPALKRIRAMIGTEGESDLFSWSNFDLDDPKGTVNA